MSSDVSDINEVEEDAEPTYADELIQALEQNQGNIAAALEQRGVILNALSQYDDPRFRNPWGQDLVQSHVTVDREERTFLAKLQIYKQTD